MNKDAQMRATINQKLIETGERERLKELLRAKLIECGWKDQLKAHCKGGFAEKAEVIHVCSCLPDATTRDSLQGTMYYSKVKKHIEMLFKPVRKSNVIKEKGLEHVTVDDLVAEITPKGRALVPDSVKKELLQRIRTFLAQHASL